MGSMLFASDTVLSVETVGDALVVRTTDIVDLGRRVPECAAELGSRLTSFQPQDESLESVFRYLVERS